MSSEEEREIERRGQRGSYSYLLILVGEKWCTKPKAARTGEVARGSNLKREKIGKGITIKR